MELFCYTRTVEDEMIYAAKLAYSMHLACKPEGETLFRPLHHNEGILYVKCVHNEDGTMNAKSLKCPWIFNMKDGFGVLAIRTEASGEKDESSEGCVVLFTSKDLVHYREIGLIKLENCGEIQEIHAGYDKKTDCYSIFWKTEDGRLKASVVSLSEQILAGGDGLVNTQIVLQVNNSDEVNFKCISEANVPSKVELTALKAETVGNTIHVSYELADYLMKKLNPAECIKMEISGSNDNINTIATYSDGSTVVRKIDWTSQINNGKRVGYVHQEHFEFPFTENRADPCCMYWNGKYYFIATNDADGNHTLYMRCSDTLEGIKTANETLILDSVTHEGIGGLLWAPEFHEIDSVLYIFHAATSGEFFREESRVMKLRQNGNPMCKDDWSAPMLVVKKDGTPLCKAGEVISLDMTTFEYEDDFYAMWSERQFLPVDQGAWLKLARIDRKEPWKLLSDPVCIVKPEYGWENNHTFVVEGPYALTNKGQLMVTYSGAAVDATYAVGLLVPKMGSDILKPENWQKNNFPLMSSRSCEGEFGTGHNSYLTDENGIVWNFYHGRPGVDGPRSSGARRVHFDIDGEPMFDVTEELDLPERFRKVIK